MQRKPKELEKAKQSRKQHLSLSQSQPISKGKNKPSKFTPTLLYGFSVWSSVYLLFTFQSPQVVPFEFCLEILVVMSRREGCSQLTAAWLVPTVCYSLKDPMTLL